MVLAPFWGSFVPRPFENSLVYVDALWGDLLVENWLHEGYFREPRGDPDIFVVTFNGVFKDFLEGNLCLTPRQFSTVEMGRGDVLQVPCQEWLHEGSRWPGGRSSRISASISMAFSSFSRERFCARGLDSCFSILWRATCGRREVPHVDVKGRCMKLQGGLHTDVETSRMRMSRRLACS